MREGVGFVVKKERIHTFFALGLDFMEGENCLFYGPFCTCSWSGLG